MAAIIVHPATMRTPRFILLSSRFCFFRCPWIRSSCSGTKSESIRAPVFSSSGCVSVHGCGHIARRRTFAWLQERECDGHRYECGDGKNEEGEELALEESAGQGRSAGGRTHLFIVVVVGAGHGARRSWRCGMETWLMREERNEVPFVGWARTLVDKSCLILVSFPGGSGERLKESRGQISVLFRPLCSFPEPEPHHGCGCCG
jgi:hypothetical protein